MNQVGSLHRWAVLASFGLCEVVSDYVSTSAGFLLHVFLFVYILFVAIRLYGSPDGKLFGVLSILPLITVIGDSISPLLLSETQYYATTATCLLLAVFLSSVAEKDVRAYLADLRIRTWDLLVVVSGVLVGWAEFGVIAVHPLAEGSGLSALVFPAIVLLISGLAEEWFLRGILFKALRRVSSVQGTISFTALSGMLLALEWRTPLEWGLVLLVGFVWGFARSKGTSIWVLSLSHGLSNWVLYLALPTLHGIL